MPPQHLAAPHMLVMPRGGLRPALYDHSDDLVTEQDLVHQPDVTGRCRGKNQDSNWISPPEVRTHFGAGKHLNYGPTKVRQRIGMPGSPLQCGGCLVFAEAYLGVRIIA